MKRKLFALVTTSVMMVAALTACGNDQGDVNSLSSEGSGSAIMLENTQHIYPFNSTSKYLDTAVDLPDIIFNTSGFENGLSGTVLKFEGTVIEYNDDPKSDFIVVETSKGNIMIDDVINITEPDADYSLPAVGTTGTFYVTYAGYSDKYKLPVTLLGANESTVMAYLEDESYIQENITTYVKTKPESIEITKSKSDASISMEYVVPDGKNIAAIADDATNVCISACDLFNVSMTQLSIGFKNAGLDICTLTSKDGGKTFVNSTTEDSVAKEDLKNLTVNITYKEGMYKVGTDIPAGEYLLTATRELDAYFKVTSDSTGDHSSIVTNGIFGNTQYVTVKDGQYITLERCTATLVE